jgi:GGDEF domain-containing protein
VASRLVASVRKHDVIAYVGPDTFGVLLVNVDRHTAFDISRRLRATLAEPLDAPSIDIPPVGTEGATSLSISVGLAHEDGLIDTAEMFEAATSAMLDARLEGGSRMLIAC